ncbi:MAG: T9SS type A sorting domain-containing protein [Bacteroidetes bacterium]|nr:T9SS type A sorting domain-containing protein [Bacteroidota bacterium]
MNNTKIKQVFIFRIALNTNITNKIRFVILFFFSIQGNYFFTQNCTVVDNTVLLDVNYESNSCNFSISVTTSNESNSSPCASDYDVCPMAPNCIGYCYSYKLFFDPLGGMNYTALGTVACSNSNTYTFSGLSLVGSYKIVAIYLRNEYCPDIGYNKCVVYADEGFTNLLVNNPCSIINQKHNNNLNAIIKKSGLIELDCKLQDNRSTILLSETGIKLLPNFGSGTGGNTYFHSYIAPCSSQAMRIRSKDSIVSKIQLNNAEDKNAGAKQNIENKKFISVMENNSNIELYPNPNNGKFTLLFKDHSLPKNIEIINNIGDIILSKNRINSYKISFDIGSYYNDFYIIKLEYDYNKIIIKKIIKINSDEQN